VACGHDLARLGRSDVIDGQLKSRSTISSNSLGDALTYADAWTPLSPRGVSKRSVARLVALDDLTSAGCLFRIAVIEKIQIVLTPRTE